MSELTLVEARARHDAVQSRKSLVEARSFDLERELSTIRDQAVKRLSEGATAHDLLAKIESLEDERRRLRRELPLLERALVVCQALVQRVEQGERDRRRPKTFNGLILPSAGSWAGQ